VVAVGRSVSETVELTVPYGDGELSSSLPRVNLAGVVGVGAGAVAGPTPTSDAG